MTSLHVDVVKFSPRLRQFFVALGPILITTSLGMVEGFSAILLPQLENSNSTIILDAELSSWIASMAALPMALGCILGGYLMEVVGRKAIHMMTCVPCVIGWLVIYFARDVTWILAGRFLTGFTVGLLGPPTGVYMSETSEPKFRGFLLASISFAIALGLFLSHLIGTYLTWQSTALVCCLFPVACAVLMIFAPESPTFLAKVGKIEQAIDAFYWCRGRSVEAEAELSILLERQKTLNEQDGGLGGANFREKVRDLCRPEFVKPLLIIVCFFVTNQWAGVNAVTFYSTSIIKSSGANLDEYLAMIVIDVVRVLSSIFACYVTKRVGRRPLAITSGVGTLLSLFTLSLYVYLSKSHPDVTSFSFVPLAALVTYVSFVTVGFVPLPWTMMGEVFPLANRGVGSGIAALSAYVSFFSVVKTTPQLFADLGADGAFLIYGSFTLFGTIVLVLFLPETKDKPLHEIEDYFKGSN